MPYRLLIFKTDKNNVTVNFHVQKQRAKEVVFLKKYGISFSGHFRI